MKIKLAEKRMVPALKAIWQECFGDTQEYVNYIFSQIVQPQWVLAGVDDVGEPQAMLCMRPAMLRAPDGRECPCVYIFGVATLHAARGKGYSTALMEAAHKYLAKQRIAMSVLVPASESLFQFYGARGYEPGFSLAKATVKGKELSYQADGCVLVPATLERMEKLRLHHFGDSSPMVCWSREYLAAIDGECRLFDGEILRYSFAGSEGYAVCYPAGGKVYVKELAADEDALPQVAAALHRRFRAEEYIFYLRPDRGSIFSPPILPFAVVKWYDSKMKFALQPGHGMPAYIAHVLD